MDSIYDRVTGARHKIERIRGAQKQLESALSAYEYNIKIFTKESENIFKAEAIIKTVAEETQKSLEYHISEIVSIALKAVFPQPYQMKLIFEEKRNSIEARIVFVRNGLEINPITESGGGIVDIASFALRVALFTLKNPSSRNILILDEPFKYVSRDLQGLASEMMKKLSDKLEIQFIVITHDRALIDSADRIFEVKNVKGNSICENVTK